MQTLVEYHFIIITVYLTLDFRWWEGSFSQSQQLFYLPTQDAMNSMQPLHRDPCTPKDPSYSSQNVNVSKKCLTYLESARSNSCAFRITQ